MISKVNPKDIKKEEGNWGNKLKNGILMNIKTKYWHIFQDGIQKGYSE